MGRGDAGPMADRPRGGGQRQRHGVPAGAAGGARGDHRVPEAASGETGAAPMRRVLIALSAGVLFAVGGGAIHPFGPVRENNGTGPVLSGAVIDAANLKRIEEACTNCHSEGVQWPWYSYGAPASWLLERDVQRARAQLNFSSWSDYS